MTVGALAALALGGAVIANATGGGSSSSANTEPHDSADQAVTGSAATNAGAAARTAVGGGKVVSVEGTDEGGAAVYEVKIDSSGKVTEVQLDKSFGVVAQKADDDKSESKDTGEGDGETNDDN